VAFNTPFNSWKTASVHQKHPVPNVAVSVFVPAGILMSFILFDKGCCFADGSQAAVNNANVVISDIIVRKRPLENIAHLCVIADIWPWANGPVVRSDMALCIG